MPPFTRDQRHSAPTRSNARHRAPQRARERQRAPESATERHRVPQSDTARHSLFHTTDDDFVQDVVGVTEADPYATEGTCSLIDPGLDSTAVVNTLQELWECTSDAFTVLLTGGDCSLPGADMQVRCL